MNELKWKWAFGPYLDQPEGQKESAIKAGYVKVVSKQSADEAIAELKAKLDEKDTEIESLKASHYAEMVDAGMRERRLRRALYKACANWADVVAFEETEGIGHDNSVAERWRKMERKCLAKAEEYK